jgi:hypothetical protein
VAWTTAGRQSRALLGCLSSRWFQSRT